MPDENLDSRRRKSRAMVNMCTNRKTWFPPSFHFFQRTVEHLKQNTVTMLYEVSGKCACKLRQTITEGMGKEADVYVESLSIVHEVAYHDFKVD